ncbi:MAG: FmdB family zinc ribbon protein [Dehalococcoidia bacterium]
MPRYDYSCGPCDLQFEVSRSFAEADKPVYCPFCEAPAVRGVSIPLATFTRGSAASSPLPAAPSSRWSHHGHSHGPGATGHAH